MTDDLALFDEHGAIVADATAQAWKVSLWENCILRQTGEFSADKIQEPNNLPDLGPATGGVFLRLSRAGLIKRCGYRISDKPSRAGGVIAVWTVVRPATEDAA